MPNLAKKRDDLADGVALDRKLVQTISRLELEDQIAQLKDVLSGAWKKSSQKALIKAIGQLNALSGPVTPDELDKIQEAVAEVMGTDFESLVKGDLVSMTEAVYKTGMFQVLPSGASILFGLPDLDAIQALSSNSRFWVKSFFNDNLQEAFRAQLNDYFLGGYNRSDLATLMRVHFAAMTDQKDSYWDLLADHTTTKIREIGRLAGYDRAGVTVVRVKAWLDDRTTEFCRRIHGHVIAVNDLTEHVGNYMEACKTRDKEAIKAAWPWWSDKQATEKLTSANAINRQIKAGKIGLPPYHARCRTITVSEFEEAAGSHVQDNNWKLAPYENPIAAHRADPARRSSQWKPVKPARPLKPLGPKRPSVPAPGPARAIDTSAGLLEDVAEGWEPPRYKPKTLPDKWLTEDLDNPPRIPKPPAPPKAPPPPKGWEEIPGTQAGSNAGGQFIGPNGKKHYVKFYANADQAKHEMLANTLSEKLGVGAPKTWIEEIEVNGLKRTGLVTEWIDDASQLKEHLGKKFTAADKKQLTKHYLNAALMGNWDVVGAEFDNLVKAGRKWYAIDQGGSFIFRAQGGIKNYGAVADELESLLLPGRKAGQVFSPILAETIKKDPDEYIKWLSKLTGRQIAIAAQDSGLFMTGIHKTIAARRDYIIGEIKKLKKTGAAGARTTLPPRAHIGREMTHAEAEALIKEDAAAHGINLSDDLARAVARTTYEYTGSDYSAIRNAQMGRVKNAKNKRRAMLLEEYLDIAAPFPPEEVIWRGMREKREVFESLDVGELYSLKAVSSFTTNSRKARRFAGAKSSGVLLKFKNGTALSTTIQHNSNFFEEYEVLVSGRVWIKILKKEVIDDRLVVTCELGKVDPLTREIIKFSILLEEEGFKVPSENGEKPQWLIDEQAESDARHPIHIIKLDGRQVLYHPDGTEEEIGPEHPWFNHYADL